MSKLINIKNKCDHDKGIEVEVSFIADLKKIKKDFNVTLRKKKKEELKLMRKTLKRKRTHKNKKEVSADEEVYDDKKTAQDIEPAQVPRFKIISRTIDPINFHVVLGIVLYDDVKRKSEDFLEKGIFSGVNMLCRITSVGYDMENEIIGMTLISRGRSNTPWRLFYSRLNSLGDSNAKALLRPLEQVCVRGEELIKRAPIESFSENHFGLKVVEVTTGAQLGEEIMSFLKSFANYGVYGFVRKGKQLNLQTMNMIEVVINKSLCTYLGIDVKDWVLHCLRNGFPEFISIDSYYDYWFSVFEDMSGNYIPTWVRLRTQKGGYKYACTRKCERKAFFYKGDFYLVIVQSFDFGVDDKSNKPMGSAKEHSLQALTMFSEDNKSYMESVFPFF